MSREFGDYNSSGYFHQKLHGAAEDAKEGRTIGARLMYNILLPLSGVGHYVASEEAGDCSESPVVNSIFDELSIIKSAVSAMESYIQPAKDLAVKSLVTELKKDVSISDVVKGHCTATVPRRSRTEQHLGLLTLSLRELVREKTGKMAHFAFSQSSCSESFVTYGFSVHFDENCEKCIKCLKEENDSLKAKLALAIDTGDTIN